MPCTFKKLSLLLFTLVLLIVIFPIFTVQAASPKNVAVLFSSLADIYICAGGQVSITVGETVERGITGEEVILVDEGAGKQINLELLISAQPDLVIGSLDIPAQAAASEILNRVGIPCLLFRVESFDDYLSVLKQMTEITGRADLYEQYGEMIAEEIQKTRSLMDTDPFRFFFIRTGSTASSTKVKKSDEHFAAEMLVELGGINLADDGQLGDGLNAEAIWRADPDCLFISLMGDESAAMEHMLDVLAQPVFQLLRCVQEENVIFLPRDLFHYKPNQRWSEAYQYLLNEIYKLS